MVAREFLFSPNLLLCCPSSVFRPTTRGACGGLKLPRTFRLRSDANQCASDMFACAKPKNFPYLSSLPANNSTK